MKPKTISTKDMSHTDWLMLRKNYIGGSDAGTILGVNKWKSRTQLFFEKVNPELSETADNEFMYWGNVLEDVVAKEFEKRTGKKVRKSNKFYIHPEYEFMSGNVDRLIIGEKALLECKTTSQYNSDQWEDDEIPAPYICQVQHYLAVTGLEIGYIAVLIGGNKFIWKEIPRDDEFIDILIREEKEFWNEHVLKEVIPEIDGSKATTDFLSNMFTDIDDDEIVIEADEMFEAIVKIEENIKNSKELVDSYKNKIKFMMKDHEKASSDKFIATWKKQTSKRLDKTMLIEKFGKDGIEDCYKESKSRVFKYKKIKGE